MLCSRSAVLNGAAAEVQLAERRIEEIKSTTQEISSLEPERFKVSSPHLQTGEAAGWRVAPACIPALAGFLGRAHAGLPVKHPGLRGCSAAGSPAVS